MGKPSSPIDDQALMWLVKLNSGQVSSAQEQAFFTWLHSSTAHQAAYLRAEQLWVKSAIIANVPMGQPTPAAAETRHITKQHRRKNPLFSGSSALVWGNWAIAVCALVAVIAIGFSSGRTSSTHTHWASGVGEQRQIHLEDGTHIVLNTNSLLEVSYNSNHREARLVRGEAYFDVHRDPNRPFDVHTAHGRVRVLGTHFAVHQKSTDTLVTVMEGRVALAAATPADEGFTALAELRPDEQLTLLQAQQGARPKQINAKAALAWRNKQLVVQQQKLTAVLAELKRYYPTDITLADPAMGEREITAVLQIDTLDKTLAALSGPLNVTPHYSGDRKNVILKSAH